MPAPSPRVFDELSQDVRFAARGLRRNPGFAALAVVVLALAIAANTAIFALVDVLMLRPLHLGEPGRLVRVFNRNTVETDAFRPFSYPNFADLREGSSAFEDVAAFAPTLVGLDRGDGTVRREFSQLVSANYFSTLGAPPALGRSFTAEEEKPNAEIRAVVVSHAFWARSGADPAMVGTSLRINGEDYSVVGVAPEGFSGVSALLTTDLWLPLGVYGTSAGQFVSPNGGDLSARDRHELMVIARLHPGVTEEQAEARLQTVASSLAAEYPDVNRDYGVVLGPMTRLSLSSHPTRDTAFTAASAFMMAMAGIVLLVACLNLANMFLARGSARRTEIAIRQSLGGGRARILRQLLTEGLVVALAGGAAGLVLGLWAARWVVASIVPVLPFGSFAFDVGLDLRVVVAAVGFCVLATLLFALGPSLELVKTAVVDDLKESANRGGASGPRRSGRRMVPRNALVVAQIALSLALISAAGLFVRSAQRVRSYQPEFAVDGRLLVELDAALASLDQQHTLDLYRRVLERMRAEPGVGSAALASNVPFSSISEGDDVRLAGAAEDDKVDSENYVVSSGYFETMGLALLRGRDFTVAEAGDVASDGAGAVAIVDEPLARKLRPDGDVIGRALVLSTPREAQKSKTLEIVGVVPGVRRALFDREPQPTIYLPLAANYRSHLIVHLRARRVDQAEALLDRAAREIRAIDPRLPILSVKTLDHHLQQGIERWLVRTGASVFAALGGVAVVLALVGVYGVKSYLVSRRTREIGIRMALGATPRDVLSWMLYEGMPSLVAGLGAGVLIALGIGRVLATTLYGVGGVDLLVFVAAPALLAAAALLAAWVPSRRATRLSPSAALRQD